MGAYKPEVCQIAVELGNLLVDKFSAAEGSKPQTSDLALHPDVHDLLQKPNLNEALAQLRDTALPMQLFLEMGGEAEASYVSEIEDEKDENPGEAPMSAAPTEEIGDVPDPALAANAEVTQRREPEVIDLLSDDSSDEEGAANALQSLAATAAAPVTVPPPQQTAPPAVSQQGQIRMPRYWTEWPEGSGSYALVVTRQNFPARIAVQSTSG